MAHENYSKSLKRDPKYANVAYFNGNMLSVLTNAPTDDSDIEFSIPENSQEKVDAFLAKHEHQELISINPQAGDEEKCWDVEEFITFVKTLIAKGITPVITGVSKDGEDFIKAIETDEDIDEKDYLNLIDKTNFTELGALYKRCSHVVSVDTGAAHMSSAVGTSTLVLFFRDDAHLWAPINTEQNSFIYNSHITAEEVMSELFKKTTSQISAMPST
jgi:ADP-heptose:LPS heptosyltransferase